MPVLNGMRVITSPYLVETRTVTRTMSVWRRLVSWQWWVTGDPVLVVGTEEIPYRGVIQLDSRTLVVHPATLAKLHESLDVFKSPLLP
jgi:hypothetical protein